jgi:hypothetical protein
MSAAAPALPKRNCGRTGPVTPEGRAISSQNSRKHGACSQTLILPDESMQDFLLLLKHWCQNYRSAEGHYLFEFVRQAAKAEWFRIRAQRQYNACLATGPHPEDKTRALLLRYKTAAENTLQRSFRLLHKEMAVRSAPCLLPGTFRAAVRPAAVAGNPACPHVHCRYADLRPLENPSRRQPSYCVSFQASK